MKNAIITFCNAKYGDFLTDHWLASLKANVNLKNIDVIVLDYGLTPVQLSKLKKSKVLVFKCKEDGHIAAIRFRDMAKILDKKKYSQIMSVDGGDVIFQADISSLFNSDKEKFRAACEALYLRAKRKYLGSFFPDVVAGKMEKLLAGKREINAGVIVAPASKFLKLCREVHSLTLTHASFGPDQHAVNFIFYREGFKEIDSKYNFIITTTKRKFFIKNGEFFFADNELIPIVHNAGNLSFFRPISNFGFGHNKNELRRMFLFFTRNFLKIVWLFSKKK